MFPLLREGVFFVTVIFRKSLIVNDLGGHGPPKPLVVKGL